MVDLMNGDWRQAIPDQEACRIRVFGLEIHNLALPILLQDLRSGFIVTPNVNHVLLFRRDRLFREAYQAADYVLCDSQVLAYFSRWLGKPIQEKISGSDLFPAFYQYHQNNPNIRIFLLGAEDGVAARAQQKINQKVGRSIVVDTYSPPWGFEQDERESKRICDRIQRSGATVLVLGLGTPKQEKWFYLYRKYMPDCLSITFAIGTTINFEAGYLKRAPKWLRQAGLEWFYRLLQEPRRLWRRYLYDLVPFLLLIVREKWL